MKKNNFKLPMTRREFLKNSSKGLALAAFSPYIPNFLATSIANNTPNPEKYKKILVIVQLAGGNDGLNTLIPYEDNKYYNLRPKLAIQKSDKIHKINDLLALHPSCEKMANLYKDGQMSIIQNVGYPNPNRSHFRSTEIWETASDSDENKYEGWIGRYLDNQCSGTPEKSNCKTSPNIVNFGNSLPDSIISKENHNIFSINPTKWRKKNKNNKNKLLNKITQSSTIETTENKENSIHYLQQTLLNTLITEEKIEKIINKYRPMSNYPKNKFAYSLKNIASLIASGMETRVYYAHLGGFDTHKNQLNTHSNLLKELSEGLYAFQQDLKKHKLNDQVITMTFSEFGRRPAENSSAGTDHGTAAPLFVIGSKINNNLVGNTPSLNIGENKDLKHDIDFRQIYSTILDNWLEAPSNKIIGRKFQNLNFI